MTGSLTELATLFVFLKMNENTKYKRIIINIPTTIWTIALLAKFAISFSDNPSGEREGGFGGSMSSLSIIGSQVIGNTWSIFPLIGPFLL